MYRVLVVSRLLVPQYSKAGVLPFEHLLRTRTPTEREMNDTLSVKGSSAVDGLFSCLVEYDAIKREINIWRLVNKGHAVPHIPSAKNGGPVRYQVLNESKAPKGATRRNQIMEQLKPFITFLQPLQFRRSIQAIQVMLYRLEVSDRCWTRGSCGVENDLQMHYTNRYTNL